MAILLWKSPCIKNLISSEGLIIHLNWQTDENVCLLQKIVCIHSLHISSSFYLFIYFFKKEILSFGRFFPPPKLNLENKPFTKHNPQI